ncbi:hypothetical protein F5148DRAFT_1149264 [Russula earlei]|uniref:Uncharacterized protein n=1 Tax=Russula earlei TaxID=71964 RepID=A0ACC0U8X3_9AGAM|nr:hypothetical protein F5148DRAFT_1149264 [Russula earlei]
MPKGGGHTRGSVWNMRGCALARVDAPSAVGLVYRKKEDIYGTERTRSQGRVERRSKTTRIVASDEGTGTVILFNGWMIEAKGGGGEVGEGNIARRVELECLGKQAPCELMTAEPHGSPSSVLFQQQVHLRGHRGGNAWWSVHEAVSRLLDAVPIPHRSELLDRARHFLSSPQVMHQDYESKRGFLAEKGLADGGIQSLLREMLPAVPPRMYPAPPPSCLPGLLVGTFKLLSWLTGGSTVLLFIYYAQKGAYVDLPHPDPWEEVVPWSGCKSLGDVAAAVERSGDHLPHVTLLRCTLTDLAAQKKPVTAENIFQMLLSTKASSILNIDDESLWKTVNGVPLFHVTANGPSSGSPHWSYHPPDTATWPTPPLLPALAKLQDSVTHVVSARQTRRFQHALQALIDFTGYLTTKTYALASAMHRLPGTTPSSVTAIEEEEIRMDIKALKGLVLNRVPGRRNTAGTAEREATAIAMAAAAARPNGPVWVNGLRAHTLEINCTTRFGNMGMDMGDGENAAAANMITVPCLPPAPIRTANATRSFTPRAKKTIQGGAQPEIPSTSAGKSVPSIAIEYESVIDPKDREAIESTITQLRLLSFGNHLIVFDVRQREGDEDRTGFEAGHRKVPTSKGVSQSCHACAKSISDRAQFPSERFSSESYFPHQGDTLGALPPYLAAVDPTFQSVANVTKSLYRCYLSCKEGIPNTHAEA